MKQIGEGGSLEDGNLGGFPRDGAPGVGLLVVGQQGNVVVSEEQTGVVVAELWTCL